MSKLYSILLLLSFAASATAAPAVDPVIPIFGSANARGGLTLSSPMQIVILLTLLTLLPAAVMSVSPFLRIVIVLHFLRQALGTQSAPSNQVLVGLALFLAFLVMQPVIVDIYQRGWEPVEKGQMSWQQGFEEGSKPFKNFLLKFSREKDIRTCIEMTKSAAAAHARRCRPEGLDSCLYTFRNESGLPNRRGFVLAILDHRPGGGVYHALDRDGAVAARDGFGSIQDPALCSGGWLESRGRIAPEKFLLVTYDPRSSGTYH